MKVNESLLWIARAGIVAVGSGGVYLLFAHEDRLIDLERALWRHIRPALRRVLAVMARAVLRLLAFERAIRHKLGRWLLRDCERRPMSDEKRKEIAAEYLGAHGLRVSEAPKPAQTSDVSWEQLMEAIVR